MSPDAFYMIGFFSFFKLDNRRPPTERLVSALKYLRQNPDDFDLDKVAFQADDFFADVSEPGMDAVQTLINENIDNPYFMYGWNAARSFHLHENGVFAPKHFSTVH